MNVVLHKELTLLNKMLTPEHMVLLSKMHSDIMQLKVEVEDLKSYKQESMPIIRMLMANKEKLEEDIKVLKLNNNPTSTTPLQLGFPSAETNPRIGFTKPIIPSSPFAAYATANAASSHTTQQNTAPPNVIQSMWGNQPTPHK